MIEFIDQRTPPGFGDFFRVCRVFFYGDRAEVIVNWVYRERRAGGPYPPEAVAHELEAKYQAWLLKHEAKRPPWRSAGA